MTQTAPTRTDTSQAALRVRITARVPVDLAGYEPGGMRVHEALVFERQSFERGEYSVADVLAYADQVQVEWGVWS